MNLLATGDIAKLAGVTVDAVAQWVRRYPDFPQPLDRTSAGAIWRREDIENWLRKTGRLEAAPGVKTEQGGEMIVYAEIQEQINGPYRPLDISLNECWDIDFNNDTDWALLRENGTYAERQLLDQLCGLGGAMDEADADISHVRSLHEELTQQVEDYIAEVIRARVLAQGRYVRDSKWTRVIAD